MLRRSLVVLVFGLPGVASAHVALTDPPARDPRDYVKDGPCGRAGSSPGEVVATFVKGDTITVRWDEFVPHPGHFRLSLSTEGDGAFVDPIDYDDFYPADNVLLDDIEDPDGTSAHAVELTLPEIECDACVLQLIQVMTDKSPWGPDGGNELYYQCADIRIVADASQLPPEDEMGEESSGCATGRSTHGGGWALLGLGSLIWGLRLRRGRALRVR
jgi:Lytic polysaccharide mono-oxygenase, cellulose-degrading